MNLTAIILASLSGALAAVIASVLAGVYQNKKEKNLLVEKWMNNLRDSISELSGLSERLRLTSRDLADLLNLSDPKEIGTRKKEIQRQQTDLKGSIIASLNKIKLLVYHESEETCIDVVRKRILKFSRAGRMKFKNQEDQKALELLVDELVQSADRVGESSKDYCEKEKRILLLAKDILKYHWVQVQHGLSVKMGMLIVLWAA